MGVCYLYVLPLAYEDILKLGIARDPFVRAIAYSRRYYEFFDLSRALLVEFDSRKEAQARETALHRHLRDWNALQPITVPSAAAGKTEWYRGAYATLRAEVENDRLHGQKVHAPALPWWQERLLENRERLYEWLAMLVRSEASSLTYDHRQLLYDVFDAYDQLGVSFADSMPEEARHLVRDRPNCLLHSSIVGTAEHD